MRVLFLVYYDCTNLPNLKRTQHIKQHLLLLLTLTPTLHNIRKPHIKTIISALPTPNLNLHKTVPPLYKTISDLFPKTCGQEPECLYFLAYVLLEFEELVFAEACASVASESSVGALVFVGLTDGFVEGFYEVLAVEELG